MRAVLEYLGHRATALEQVVALGLVAGGTWTVAGPGWAAIVAGVGLLGFSLLARRA